MATSLTLRRNRRRPASRVLSSVAFSLVVLFVGWSALWLAARAEAGRSFDVWIAAEQAAGRIWTCPGRTIGGFPLAIVLRCDTPSFAEAGDPDFGGQVAALKATARLYFPTSVAVDLRGPLTVRDKAVDNGLTVNWAGARVTLRGGLPGSLDRGRLDIHEVEIAAGPGRAPNQVGAAAVTFQPLTPGSAELSAELSGVQDPDADAVFGSTAPIAAELKAALTALPRRGASLPTLLEAWREAGGTLDVTRFAFAKGGFTAEGTGTVQLDTAHRVAGRLQTRFAGLEPLAARFGIPVAAVKIGGLLSALLGGTAEAKPATDASALDLPLVLRDGRLFIGPAKTGLVLPPLY